MTVHLTLPPELAERLRHEAERQGRSPEVVLLQLLEKSLPAADARAETVALLQSWIDEDDTDAADADYDLFQALDEARTSDRRLFPAELKGVSW